MEQFYGAIKWSNFMAPFYGVCVLGFIVGLAAHMLAYIGYRQRDTQQHNHV